MEYQKTEKNKIIRGSNRGTYDVEKIHQILDDQFMGYVAYTFQDTAITIPMAYARIEDKIYIHGSIKNRMLLSLLENGKASMTVVTLDGLVLARSAFHHSVNYRSATIFGSVTKVVDEKLKMKTLERMIEHMIEGRWETLRPINEKEFNSTLVLELAIETASAKVRDVGVLDEKEDYEFPVWAGVIPMKQIALDAVSDQGLPQEMATPEHVLNYVKENK